MNHWMGATIGGIADAARRCFAGVVALAPPLLATTDERETDGRWALLAPSRSSPPTAESPFVRDPIDAFVLAQLRHAGLEPSPPADRRTLIRRATLGVTGLPPTPEQVRAFVDDSSSDAYERLVDRLLASREYAERTATDWLDLVRFAETHGFEMNQPRANAWPYRDWVIDAFHRDLPWPDFVRAQLCGDRPGDEPATGFLVAGAWDEVKSPDPERTATQRDDELHGMVSVVGTAFLGLTVGCAKCHEHRFDPIAQRDYYALRACLQGVQFGERPWPEESAPEQENLRDPVSPLRNAEQFDPVRASAVRFSVTATNRGQPCIDELEVFTKAEGDGETRNVALAANGAVARASSVYENDVHHQLEHIHDGLYGNSKSWIPREVESWIEIEFARPEWVDTVVWARDREGVYADRLAIEYTVELQVADSVGDWRVVASSADRAPWRAARMVYSGRFDPVPPPTHRLGRGDPMAPREVVRPGGLECLDVPFGAVEESDESSRRRELAEWIGSECNPLTARVAVNRIWQQHFGRGLVATPSDFGAMGARPTHPELLDQLALDFMENGWSPKSIHRRILLSGTYRQSSERRTEAESVDGDVRLLWRYPSRRLPAETIRDSMLAVSGALNPKRGGPGYSPFRPNDNYVRVYEAKDEFGEDDFRRSIYGLRVRMHPDPTFRCFDLPDGGQPCARRERSTTPLQALSLLHAPFVHVLAERFAARVRNEAAIGPTAVAGPARSSGSEAEVVRAFERALQRSPDEVELEASCVLVEEYGLAALCRALLGSSELAWLD